jgi:hypothetical protein
MNLNHKITFSLFAMASVFFGQTSASVVTHTIANSFIIPYHTKRLGLLGCTPHPAQYIKMHGYSRKKMRTLKLDDFLDIDYLRDSFDQVLLLCKQHVIDHLIIAYLPIYFADMHQLIHHNFVAGVQSFFKSIAPQMRNLIKEEADRLNCTTNITIIVPPRSALKKVPANRITMDDRIRYLIKQFPQRKNFSNSDLETIVIINNQGEDDQNDTIIRYLKYAYLFEKPVAYETINTNKPKFHKYL